MRLVPLWLVLACSGTGTPTDPMATWRTCSDAPCRYEAAVPAFAANRKAVLTDLRWLDPYEQAALVDRLSAAAPDAIPDLCDDMEEGSPAGETCRSLEERPHLNTEIGPAPTLEGSATRLEGPSQRHLPTPPTGQPPWLGALPADATAAVADCPVDSLGACADERAQLRAAAGDLRAVGLICTGGHGSDAPVTDEGGYSECLFRAAEAHAAAAGSKGFASTAMLCDQAGEYATGCLFHTLVYSLPAAPSAELAGADHLANLQAAIGDVRAAVGDDLADLYEAQMWAVWLRESFAQSVTVGGDLVAAVPEQATEHALAAAAWRYVEVHHPGVDAWEATSFDTLVSGLGAALAEPSPLPEHGQEAGSAPTLWKPTDLWAKDLNGEGVIPATFFLGPARRATGSDRETDLQICVLEAAARLYVLPPPPFFFDQVEPSRDPRVRWTAARIGSQLYVGYAKEQKLGDIDPLVMQRLHSEVDPRAEEEPPRPGEPATNPPLGQADPKHGPPPGVTGPVPSIERRPPPERPRPGARHR